LPARLLRLVGRALSLVRRDTNQFRWRASLNPTFGSLRENTFEVEPGRVSYAGSYKLMLIKGGLFRDDKGSFSRSDTPQAERQLLEWLAKELAASSWGSSVNAWLAEDRN
jgi:hypothetical protein